MLIDIPLLLNKSNSIISLWSNINNDTWNIPGKMLQWYFVRLRNPSYSICTYKYQHPTREAAIHRVPTDGLRNYTSGSIGKPRIFPLGDMTRARNDRKPGVLMDLPVSRTGAAILANETIIVTTHSNKGLSL